MEYVYAALLLHKAGKEVNEKSVTEVMKAAGVKADDSRVKSLIAALDGVNIEEAIEKAAPVMTTTTVTESKDSKPEASEKKEEKKKEEVSEEDTAAGLGALFG